MLPIALALAVVNGYLSDPRTYPCHDGEDWGDPIPVTNCCDPDPEPIVGHVPRCPLGGGVTGWHAWDIHMAHQALRT